jgi:hypothetical protein
MTKLRRMWAGLAGCILASCLAEGVSAQPRMDRDWESDRGREERDWSPGRDRGWGERERDWERDRRWRSRERDCYYETRRYRNRFGETVVRRYRVCDD